MNKIQLSFYKKFIRNLKSTSKVLNKIKSNPDRDGLIFIAFEKAMASLKKTYRIKKGMQANFRNFYKVLIKRNHDCNVNDIIVATENYINSPFDLETSIREKTDNFDRKHGTVTSFTIMQHELSEKVSLDRLNFSSRYHPCPVNTVKLAINKLKNHGIDYNEFVLIDVGSGTARVLLIASYYWAFKKLIGIEISRWLHKLALSNIQACKTGDSKQKCNIFDLYCLDALDFIFPSENLVLFFWEPFFQEVICDQFTKNIENFIKKTNFKVILIFIGQIFNAVEKSKYFIVLDRLVSDFTYKNGEKCPITIFSSKNI